MGTIIKLLNVIGAIFIILGVIGGVYLMSTTDYSDYKLRKQVYSELENNEFAKLHYEQARMALAISLGAGLASIFSGIVSGIFFISMACVISLLINIRNNTLKDTIST